MNAQEMFDKVAVHILTQGERCAASPNQGCRYRLGELRCAAGCLITDEAYDPLMEGARVGNNRGSVRAALLDHALVASGVEKPLWPFLSKLQDVHDQLPVEEWPAALTKAAASYNVSDRVVTEWGRNR